MKILVVYDNHTATFFKLNRRRQWRKIGHVGNTGVAFDLFPMLRKLGCKIETADGEEEK